MVLFHWKITYSNDFQFLIILRKIQNHFIKYKSFLCISNLQISSHKYYVTFDTLTDASPYIVTEEIPVLHICGFHNHSCLERLLFQILSLIFKLCSFLRYYMIVHLWYTQFLSEWTI